MHGRLPFLAKPKDKPRDEARVAKHRRETMTRAVMRILALGESSKFEFEAACRHGLRSGLCLEGTRWGAADKFAAGVVEEALRRIGAVRPTWEQGQLEHTQFGFAPVERYFCERCAKPIPSERGARSGEPVKFCSVSCRNNAKASRQRKFRRRLDAAERAARVAAIADARRDAFNEKMTRVCDHCGGVFRTTDGRARFCSRQCSSRARPKYAGTCEVCGKKFEPKVRGTKYCGHNCAARAYKVRQALIRPPQTCAQCGNEFRSDKPKARFCSLVCSGKARWTKANGFTCEAVAAE
jgi:hypothetical protein